MLQELMGRFYVGTSADTVNISTCSAQTATLDSGFYFLSGYTGESTEQLCEELQGKFRTCIGQGNMNVTYHTNGRVVFYMNATCNITFIDTDLSTILGMNSSLSGAAKYQGTRTPRYVWRPTRQIVNYPGLLNTVWFPRSTTIAGRSKDGTSYSVVGNQLYDGELSWMHLTQSETLTPTNGTSYDDFQQFWVDVIHAGQPFRFIPDRTAYSSNTAYVTAHVTTDDDDGIGSFGDFVSRHISSYNGMWDITLPVKKYV